MGLSNNLGKLSSIITSTGSAVSMSGTLTLATTQYVGNLQFGTSSTATLGYDAGTGAMSFNIGAGAASSSAYYKFLADGTSIVTFLKGGNVGIGNTSPSYLLDVSGTLRNTTSAYFATTSGSVGIGTTSPSYTLDVYAASGYAARLNGSSYGGLILANAGTANTYMVGESTLLSIEHIAAINLRTNNADRVRITSAGNVGIGTSSPKNILQATNLASSGALPSLGSIGTCTSLYLTNNSVNYGLLMGSLPSGDSWLQVQRTDGTATAYNLQLNPNGGDINMNTSSGNRLVTAKGQTGNGYYGEVRMGNVDHSAGVVGKHVSGGQANLEIWTEYYGSGGYRAVMTVFYTGNASLTGTLTQNASDKRLKDNIKNIDNALDKVNSLNGVTFDWNDKAVEYGWSPRIKNNDVGVIAQNVQEVLPQAIAFAPFDRNDKDESKSGEDYLTVQYEKIVPLLIEAIKELSQRLDKARL